MLRDKVAGVYEERVKFFHDDPWAVRNSYIEVINDRSPAHAEGFLARTAGRQLSQPEKVTFLKLLEMQRNAMLMYTSCGWFFDNMCGIETVQIMEYAARAMQLWPAYCWLTPMGVTRSKPPAGLSPVGRRQPCRRAPAWATGHSSKDYWAKLKSPVVKFSGCPSRLAGQESLDFNS